jgi:hypothetical protein
MDIEIAVVPLQRSKYIPKVIRIGHSLQESRIFSVNVENASEPREIAQEL